MSQVEGIRAVRPDEVGAAGAMLARAFDGDPIWAALWPEREHRARSLTAMFTALVVATTSARGHVATTPRIDGAALWLPPGRDVGAWATIRSRFALPRAVLRLPSSERRDLLRLLSQFEKRRHVLVPEPHWYLQSIGVDPGSQGDGVGSNLLRDGLERADAHGSPTYLETETEANVGFYERRGFVVLEQHVLDALGLPIWLMQRRPPRG